MARLFELVLVGCALVGLTGCGGPMSAGCGPLGGCTAAVGGGCGTAGCDSCTGCGELYVDPWINHPPDCIDPCAACGNYNGQSCGKCRSAFSGIKTLWGYRCGCPSGPIAMTDRQFAPSCSAGCDGGCDSCQIEPACGCEVAAPACGCEVAMPVCDSGCCGAKPKPCGLLR